MKVKIGKYNKKSSRKIDIQIDGYDTWNLDHELALIIYPALIQLRHTKHGIPSEFGDVGGGRHECQESFDFYNDSYDDAFNEGVKRWEEILDKMIWSFEQLAIRDYSDKYHHGVSNYDWIKTDKKYPNPISGKLENTFQMVDKDPNGHYYDAEGHIEHEKRIQEGLELFGKYYRSLWD
jgi:hypothetical protein